MAGPFSLQILGVEEATVGLGIMADAVVDMSWAFEGLIREQTLPELNPRFLPDDYGIAQMELGAVPIVERRWTLEGAVADAFFGNGVNAYYDQPWQGYENEPIYAEYKRNADGGDQVLIWADAEEPLLDTFFRGDPDHVEDVTELGMQWGSLRDYARRLHMGGFWQDWDETRPDGREIIPPAGEVGFRLAKGVQRTLVTVLKASGQSPGAALAGMRGFPSTDL